MKTYARILYPVSILALLVAAGEVPATTLHARAAAPVPTQAEVYLGALLTPASGQMLSGAAAVLGVTTGAGQSEGQANTQNGQNKNSTTVALQVAGLKPLGSYTAVVGAQACTSTATSATTTGASAPATVSVHATAGGDAMVVTSTSYRLMTHGKTALALRQGNASGSLVACAALHTPARIVALKGISAQSTASGIALITPNVPVLNGMVKAGTEVLVYATGLQHNAVQPNHIHMGSCSVSSGIMFPLSTLVTDPTGRAFAGTGIPYTGSLTTGSIHIHSTTFAMEACGNMAAGATLSPA